VNVLKKKEKRIIGCFFEYHQFIKQSREDESSGVFLSTLYGFNSNYDRENKEKQSILVLLWK